MKFYSFFKYTLVLAFITCTEKTVLAQNNQLVEEDIEFSKHWEEKLNHATSPNHSHTARNENKHHSCLSLVLIEGKQNQKRLTSRLQKVLRTYSDRVELSFSFDSEHYRFHYETTGDDAVATTDSNNDGIPDYIEFMATEFENVHQKEIGNLGYVAPPSDGTIGGGQDLYDVYVTNLQEGLYGYVAPETTIGDNPNSSETETRASTSVLRMRNNYEGFGLQNDALKVTAAHEFYHSVQLGYNTDFSLIFALEGSASWMEEVIYPRIDDNFQYLNSVFENPDLAINYGFADENDPNFEEFKIQWYGAWIFFQYLGENYGEDVARVFWENLRSQSELEALNNALLTKGIDINTAFEDFFVANVVLSANSASSPFTYVRAADYINYLRENTDSEKVRIEGTINFTGRATTWRSDRDGNRRLMRFSADYVQLNTQEERFDVEILHDDLQTTQIGVQFISFQPNGRVTVIKDFPTLGESAKIEVERTNSEEQMYLIVYRTGNEFDDFTSKQYRINVFDPQQPLGINDDLGTNNYFKIAANPISDNLRFIYQLDNPTIENYKVSITDVLGKKIINNVAIDKSINTTKWAKGTYFVTLFDDKKPIAVRKVIVQ